MSLNPVDSFMQAEALFKTKGTQPKSPDKAGGAFAQLLDSASQPEGARPPGGGAEAAEILRLEMMRSAIYMEPATPPPFSLMDRQSVQTLFSRLAESGQDAPAESLPPASAAPDPQIGSSSIDSIIQKAAKRYGVEAGLIKAVIKTESNFNPNAVSHAGAQGLMQLMPATARGLGVTDSFDPEQNVMGGTRFLKDMLDRYGGDMDKALAAYNWGPGNVDRGRKPLPTETREYLTQVKRRYKEFTG